MIVTNSIPTGPVNEEKKSGSPFRPGDFAALATTILYSSSSNYQYMANGSEHVGNVKDLTSSHPNAQSTPSTGEETFVLEGLTVTARIEF